MAEDGIGDYGAAKRKAARSLGVGEGEALPSNEEVAAELRAYQALYQDEEQAERLIAMRRAALDVMRLLDAFHPYLTGAVLDGTAARFSEADIHLFADSAKDVEIFLLSGGISYEPAEMGRRGPDAPEARLRVEWDGVPVVLSVYPYAAERRQHGAAHARTKAVAALLENQGI